MKIHSKRKQARRDWKELARGDRINNAAGQWVQRSQVGNAMGRDFSPQSGK